MGGAGDRRRPRGSDLGVEAGSALRLTGAATPQPRGVAEACAAGRAAPPACWRAVVRSAGGLARRCRRPSAPGLPLLPLPRCRIPTAPQPEGKRNARARSSGETAGLAAARAGGRSAHAGRERRGEGVGRGGRGRREGGPLQERGSARACVQEPPAAVEAQRGGRREETKAELAKEPIRCQDSVLRRQSLLQTGWGRGVGAGEGGKMLNK